MTLQQVHQSYGAILADDGIPLHYGDQLAEYRAGLEAAILLDRSHEGRVQLKGSDRFELINRMSTGKLLDTAGQPAIAENTGQATIFTDPTARILERVMFYNRADHLLMITEPGRGQRFTDFLQKHIFFRDDARPVNLTPGTHQLALHGPQARTIMQALDPAIQALPAYGCTTIQVKDATVIVAERKAISGTHWILIMPGAQASDVYRQVMSTGEAYGLIPAGSLTYNALRIRSGRPAGRELSQDYIPLEVGLWDEISFDKGCYTGQEIIARMESRQRIAKTIVRLSPESPVTAPAPVYDEDRQIGTLTSSVRAPDGQIFALAVLKVAAAAPATQVMIGEDRIPAQVRDLPGAQPPFLEPDQQVEDGT